MLLHELELDPKFIWKPQVIRVKKADIGSLGCPDACVARGRGTAVFLAKVLDPISKLTQNQPGVVSGSIINHDNLELAARLVQNALNRLRNEAGRVVRWDNDSNKGGVHFVNFVYRFLVL